MRPVFIFVTRDGNTVNIPRADFEKLINETYDAGYEDGKRAEEEEVKTDE